MPSLNDNLECEISKFPTEILQQNTLIKARPTDTIPIRNSPTGKATHKGKGMPGREKGEHMAAKRAGITTLREQRFQMNNYQKR